MNIETQQPLDTLLTQLGIANADLVRASTEQLSFKMVQKGRTGRHLTPNIQEKILRALLKLKPDLKLKCRQLFHYEMAESITSGIQNALSLIQNKKIKYPRFIDLLLEAGVTHYSVEVAPGRVTFYAPGGQAHIEQSPAVMHPIHGAGILSYEVNLRKRRIIYKGETLSFREIIPPTIAEEPKVIALPKAPSAVSVAKKKKKAKNKSAGVKNSLKGRKASRNRRKFKR